ncbi:hypothetical protein BGW80DRAFT_1325886 [Lactifluus volemus]|nr:hypothetical protein BGW80DRAFT_1352376 [Lactifluus volemus]KAH9970886.1 hypothetical protein BGW80DRAFT_1325886 [Lactifluus volemus]
MVQVGAQILHCGQVASGAGIGMRGCFVGARNCSVGHGGSGIEILGCLVVAYAR